MGMFDSVWVKCPNCGEENQFQSKSGICLLYNYDLKNCPEDVLQDINRHSPIECDCGIRYSVDVRKRKVVQESKPSKVKIQLLFAWYDLWIGAFWDSKKKWLYILPLPTIGIIIKFKP